jgi:hypothetical protein
MIAHPIVHAIALGQVQAFDHIRQQKQALGTFGRYQGFRQYRGIKEVQQGLSIFHLAALGVLLVKPVHALGRIRPKLPTVGNVIGRQLLAARLHPVLYLGSGPPGLYRHTALALLPLWATGIYVYG